MNSSNRETLVILNINRQYSFNLTCQKGAQDGNGATIKRLTDERLILVEAS
jgi:hypothetical protein